MNTILVNIVVQKHSVGSQDTSHMTILEIEMQSKKCCFYGHHFKSVKR